MKSGKQIHLEMAAKTAMGMHMGRPSVFVFEEDLDDQPIGRINNKTVIKSQAEILALAKYYNIDGAAKHLGISSMTLRRALKDALIYGDYMAIFYLSKKGKR